MKFLRIHDVGKWVKLEADHVIDLPAVTGDDDFRTVTVEVNCAGPAMFTLVQGDNDEVVTFLGVVDADLGSLQFGLVGAGQVWCDSEADVWYFTNENTVLDVPIDTETYAGVENRQTRNPQLELMMFKMRQNDLRRDAQLAADRAAYAEQFAALVAASKADPVTGEVVDEADGGDGAAAGGAGGGEPAPASAAKAAKKAAGAVDDTVG